MKINNVKNNKIKWITTSIVVAVLLLCAAAYYVYGMGGNILGWRSSEDTSSREETETTNVINEEPATDEEKTTGDNIKSDSIKESEEDDTNSNDPGEKVSVLITVANQAGPDSPLQVRAQIGAVTNSGVCTLTLENGDRSITKTADVQALASFSTCKGFDIPSSELVPGQWSVAINYKSESREGAASVVVTVK